jgi:hypothetical protein
MKQHITVEQWEEIEDRASAATYFLTNKRFTFLVNYLNNALKEIETIILTNRVQAVHEEMTISDKLKRIFITPKQVQLDELVGQYKFITQFLDFVKFTAQQKEELERQASLGKVIIERSKENG